MPMECSLTDTLLPRKAQIGIALLHKMQGLFCYSCHLINRPSITANPVPITPMPMMC